MPASYVSTATDCNDLNASINPGTPEICDEVDNDCDALIDDADQGLSIRQRTPPFSMLMAMGLVVRPVLRPV